MNNITVVISALNEEKNVANLLTDLLSQDLAEIKLNKIYVVSDGSSDRTVSMASAVKSSFIKVISHHKRKGKSTRINEIFSLNIRGPIIVLDADIKIFDNRFLYKISKPIFEGFDLTSCGISALESRSLFEDVLRCNLNTISTTFGHYNDGHNVYTCRGAARVFSERLAKKIFFPSVVGEDAYSFFYCLSNGYKYKFVNDAKVYIRLPDNIRDYFRQSVRFAKSRKVMKDIFTNLNTDEYYKLPKVSFLKYSMLSFLKHPVLNLIFINLYLISSILSNLNQDKSDLWKISDSSKQLD